MPITAVTDFCGVNNSDGKHDSPMRRGASNTRTNIGCNDSGKSPYPQEYRIVSPCPFGSEAASSACALSHTHSISAVAAASTITASAIERAL